MSWLTFLSFYLKYYLIIHRSLENCFIWSHTILMLVMRHKLHKNQLCWICTCIKYVLFVLFLLWILSLSIVFVEGRSFHLITVTFLVTIDYPCSKQFLLCSYVFFCVVLILFLRFYYFSSFFPFISSLFIPFLSTSHLLSTSPFLSF